MSTFNSSVIIPREAKDQQDMYLQNVSRHEGLYVFFVNLDTSCTVSINILHMYGCTIIILCNWI